MKTIIRNTSSIKAILTVISIIAIIHSCNTNIQATYEYYMKYSITSAQYGDYDKDNFLDDIQITTELKTNYFETIYFFMRLEITLPSTLKYSFTTDFTILTSSTTVVIIYTAYDCAIESGIYKASLSGIIAFDDSLYFSSSSIFFDPPTEKGPGDPTLEVSIIYT